MEYTIVLVDDDGDDRLFFRDAVKKASRDISCITLEDGFALISYLKEDEKQPDLIFLDINMPVMNGWECLSILKEDDAYRDIPVIMYSTSRHDEEISKAKDAGAFSFFNKPHDFTVLKQAVSDAIAHVLEGKLMELPEHSKLFY